MFYYIANQDFQTYKKGDIVAKFEQFAANEFTASNLVDVVEASDFKFNKVVYELGYPESYTDGANTTTNKPLVIDDSWTHVPAVAGVEGVNAVPEHWTKEGFESVFSQPMIEDTSWVHTPAQQAVPAQAEYWENGPEIVYENPNDETYIYHPAIVAQEAIVESWTKDSTIVYVQPMIEDSSWTHVLATEGIPAVLPVVEHWIKDGYEAQYSQPMKLDPAYSVIPEINPGYKVVEDTDAVAAAESARVLEQQEETGRKVRECCDRILDLVIGYNMENLSSEEITQMMVDYKDVYDAIRAYRPNVVRSQLTSINSLPELKSQIITILDSYNFL